MTEGKEAFRRRLAAMLDERGWSKSDLARRMYGSYTVAKTGHNAARHRDRVSAWANGTQYPNRKNMVLLARTFGVPLEDLFPSGNSARDDPPRPDVRPLLLVRLEERLAAVLEILRQVKRLEEAKD